MEDVFFIDDESDIRLAIEQSFELEDISARFFACAEDAMLAIKQQGMPKVVITDICLPGLSGENLLSTVLNQDSDVPVILITATVIFPWLSMHSEMALMTLLKSRLLSTG